MTVAVGIVVGFIAWFLVSYLVAGLFTVNQNERAVKTSFGRAQRVGRSHDAGRSRSQTHSTQTSKRDTPIRRCA